MLILFEQIGNILGSDFHSYTITSWWGSSSYGDHDQNGFMGIWYLCLLCLVRDGACLFAYSSMLREWSKLRLADAREILNDLQLGFYPLEIYRSIGDKLWSRFMCQGLAAQDCDVSFDEMDMWFLPKLKIDRPTLEWCIVLLSRGGYRHW